MRNMTLYSEVTNEEYEVKMYASSFGGYGIDHSSLQDILENKLSSQDVSYHVEVITASASYCAVTCTIKNNVTGRKTVGLSDINTKMPGGREDVEFMKAHPLLAATNSAIDTAVRSYLKWQRIYSLADESQEAGQAEDVEPAQDTPDDMGDLINKVNQVIPEEEAPAGPELPFDPDFNASDTSVSDSDTSAEDSDFPGMNAPEQSEEDTKWKRMEELGKMYPPKNTKFQTSTLDEIWENNRYWMDFVKKNRSNKYEYIREFISLKEELKGEKTKHE